MHTEIDSCEQYVLACMMHDSDALDVGCQKLQLDDFSNTSHRVIFDVIKKLHDINKIITVKAISEVINTTSELRFNNSEALIDQIYASFTNSLEFDINLEMIKNFKMKNLLVKLCEKTKTTDFNIINIDDKLFEHRDALDEIMARKSRSTMVSAADVIEQLKQWESTVLSSDDKRDIGVITEIPELDKFYQVMAPTQLHVLAARPGQGKTAFAVDLALKVAKKCKAFNDSIEPGEKPKCVLFISCEMNAQEIINRMISNLSLTSYSKYGDQIRRIAGDQNALLAVRNAQALIASLPLDIDDSSKDIESIAGAVREKSFAKDIQLVVIDYIQRIGSTNARKNSNTHEIITKTVMELKNIAKKRNTVVFALAAGGRSLDSLTRTTTAASGNKGKSSEPELGDIRDSSSIEFEADTVSYLYEDTGGKDGDNATKNDAVAIVKYCMKKNRNGTAGDTRLRFEKPFSRFTTGGSALRFSPSND